MKRTLTILMTIVICITLSACSKSGKPKDMDKETYEIGKRAVEIVQDFLDAKITAQEAYDKLDVMRDRLDGLEFDGKDQRMADAKNSLIRSKISRLSISLLNQKTTGGSLKYVSEDLKELKEELGLK